ncbi:MAG: DUF4105 domain-containing protein [Rhodospirillales bacterium]|nr:DUF4105 domain-containing protein [Rhodospirillales bacterium]
MAAATVRACLIALAAVLATLTTARAVRSDDYLAELIGRARSERLASDPQWLALGFYVPDLFGSGVDSLIDNPGFFLAKGGRSDPASELEASLAAFAEPAHTGDIDSHPQCSKPARYRWLRTRLGFDSARLPEQPCPKLAAWLARIDPGEVSLIFPAAYLNNPSSMFGHTLIRFDPPPERRKGALTGHTAHFAADHHGETGALFALKGLAGGYQGYFATLPYYEKVTQYSDIENRDIWEYMLNISSDGQRMMLYSLWEVNLQPISYYFFSTNCSFVLLSLLNVARPDLRVIERFPVYAIPVDTVRAVVEGTGLLRQATFRPAQRTDIAHRWSQLDTTERRITAALIDGSSVPDDAALQALTPQRRARVIEVAQAYLQYQIETGATERPEMAPRAMALLRARSAIQGIPPEEQAPTPPVRPDEGHHSARLAAGGGATGNQPFAEVALRPAYHDLLDPAGGYVVGAAIDFLDIHLRWYESPVPMLESATLIGIESITPRDTLFQALSWRVRFGVDRWRDHAARAGDLVGAAGGGAGPSWSLSDTARVYAFADTALLADGYWPHGRIFSIGPAMGLLWSPAPGWTVRPEARGMLVVEGGAAEAFEASLEQGFALARDTALRIAVSARNDGDATYPEISTMLDWYF